VTKFEFAEPLRLLGCFARVCFVLSDGPPSWNANVWFCLEFGFYPSPATRLVCVSPHRPLARMASAVRDNAVLVLPGPKQEPLRVPNVGDIVPIVWNGRRSFFVATAGAFSPSHNTFYFVLLVSHTLEGVWYVWAPVRYQDRIRVSDDAKLSCRE
jgi:hypothetical protein